MGTRRLLWFTLVAFGILAGCSKKADAPRDVTFPSSDDAGPTIEEQPLKGAANDELVETATLSEAVLGELRKKPITTGKGELNELLAKWWKEGVAAGNVGDYYDNRDEAHSDLDTKAYPQLQRVVYSADEIKKRDNWSLTTSVRPHVTLGNSSTAASTKQGGSNPRFAYSFPMDVARLAEQYKRNNLYIYPECGDHRPGHNGLEGGYGDLYPTNTPYLLISQGISWSDQPFMHAVASTLAAFRPDVKQKLAENGLLMPTLQMILRSTNKRLANPKEYLTGKAHPTVFEGSSIDPLRMAKLAHEITVDTVPPLVRIEVVEEDLAENGRDFFEQAFLTEVLANTPQVIARIWRGKSGRRRMVVSAAGSSDINKKPLAFTWVVLRGDEKQIRITPRNKAGSEVEIVVPYHPRRPVAPNATLESNRVDIGVFVHNGAYHSAPGFITFYTLDNESRAYDEKGRLVEIGFGGGDVGIRVSDYDVLLQALRQADGLAAKLLDLTEVQRAALKDAGENYHRIRGELKRLQSEAKACGARSEKDDSRMKKAQAELERARKADTEMPSDATKAALAAAKKKAGKAAARQKEGESAIDAAYEKIGGAEKKLDEILGAKRPGLGGSVNEFIDRRLRQLSQNPGLFDTCNKLLPAGVEKVMAARGGSVEAARQRLVQTGLATKWKGGRLEWHLIRLGSTKHEQRLTPFAAQLVEGFNAALLSELVLPGALSISSSPNFVSQFHFTAKFWRDVHHYEAKGTSTGWTRYNAKGVTEFTEDGLIVLDRDGAGRPIKVQTVRYEVIVVEDPAEPDKLEMKRGEEIINYSYENDKRMEKSRIGVEKK